MKKSDNIKNNQTIIDAVWEKGQISNDYDPANYRFDRAGALIERSAYGDTNSMYGWEIDHILPEAKGGTDNLANLQPLQWENNRSKNDDYPCWTSVATYYAGYNVNERHRICQK